MQKHLTIMQQFPLHSTRLRNLLWIIESVQNPKVSIQSSYHFVFEWRAMWRVHTKWIQNRAEQTEAQDTTYNTTWMHFYLRRINKPDAPFLWITWVSNLSVGEWIDPIKRMVLRCFALWFYWRWLVSPFWLCVVCWECFVVRVVLGLAWPRYFLALRDFCALRMCGCLRALKIQGSNLILLNRKNGREPRNGR